MKKKILTIALFAVTAVSSFMLGTTQEKTVTEVKEVEKVVEVVTDEYIDTTSDEFSNNYIDMRAVTDFEATENGLQIYTNDGSGYYWENI